MGFFMPSLMPCHASSTLSFNVLKAVFTLSVNVEIVGRTELSNQLTTGRIAFVFTKSQARLIESRIELNADLILSSVGLIIPAHAVSRSHFTTGLITRSFTNCHAAFNTARITLKAFLIQSITRFMIGQPVSRNQTIMFEIATFTAFQTI